VGSVAALQARLDKLLAAEPVPQPVAPKGAAPEFSPFVGDGAARAGVPARTLCDIAQADGLATAAEEPSMTAVDLSIRCKPQRPR
jgi:hypothetical protein